MYNGKPVIGLTGSYKPDDWSPQHFMNESYFHAVRHFGGIPVLLPVLAREDELEYLASNLDGLLLTGGNDMDPVLFGETILNDTVQLCPERDRAEYEALKLAVQKDLPVLGICRGCQLINVALGGTLYQDLAAQKGLVHSDPALRHEVSVEGDSVLGQLFGTRFLVNSTHHQAVKDTAPGLRVTARSKEGLVEAFEHETLPVLATQFHPERLTGALWDDRTPDFAPLFSYFIALCSK